MIAMAAKNSSYSCIKSTGVVVLVDTDVEEATTVIAGISNTKIVEAVPPIVAEVALEVQSIGAIVVVVGTLRAVAAAVVVVIVLVVVISEVVPIVAEVIATELVGAVTAVMV